MGTVRARVRTPPGVEVNYPEVGFRPSFFSFLLLAPSVAVSSTLTAATPSTLRIARARTGSDPVSRQKKRPSEISLGLVMD